MNTQAFLTQNALLSSKVGSESK